MPVSLVVPALNEERYLPTLLASIAELGRSDLEVIVVDGQSDDRTQDVARAFAEQMQSRFEARCVVSHKRNVAHQRNLGAQEARNSVIMFLDADTRLPERATFDALLQAFELEQCAAASCRFRPMPPHPLAKIYYWILYRFHRFQERRHPYAAGACIITRKDVFERVGGFDETIRVNEDAEYCLRASRFGPFRIFPQAIWVSTRRFDKEGYFRMGVRYLRLFLDRTFRGELRDDHIPYEFGHYDR